jgi:hypothetical protein
MPEIVCVKSPRYRDHYGVMSIWALSVSPNLHVRRMLEKLRLDPLGTLVHKVKIQVDKLKVGWDA